MSKRTLEEQAVDQMNPLKGGERPQAAENGDDVGVFEDDYEDEFESEDEIFEAGVDGRPDDEREVEERRGTWITLVALCEIRCQLSLHDFADSVQMAWMWTSRHLYPVEVSLQRGSHYPQIHLHTRCYTLSVQHGRAYHSTL